MWYTNNFDPASIPNNTKLVDSHSQSTATPRSNIDCEVGLGPPTVEQVQLAMYNSLSSIMSCDTSYPTLIHEISTSLAVLQGMSGGLHLCRAQFQLIHDRYVIYILYIPVALSDT